MAAAIYLYDPVVKHSPAIFAFILTGDSRIRNSAEQIASIGRSDNALQAVAPRPAQCFIPEFLAITIYLYNRGIKAPPYYPHFYRQMHPSQTRHLANSLSSAVAITLRKPSLPDPPSVLSQVFWPFTIYLYDPGIEDFTLLSSLLSPDASESDHPPSR